MIKEIIRKNALLLLLVLIVVAVPSIYAYDYVQNNPKFCTTCHLMNDAYATWDASAMHDLNCHKCHESDMATNISHLTSVLLTGTDKVSKSVEIDNQLCKDCHESKDPKWLQVADTAGHKVHASGDSSLINCIDCHGKRLHVFSPPQDVCLGCHVDDRQKAIELMDNHCISCHDFLITNTELSPGDHCLTCHEGKDSMGTSFPNNAHASSECYNCHNPHEDSIFPNCTACHEAGGGLHNSAAHYDCITCHKPHDGEQLRDNCLSCHPDKKYHYPNQTCANCHSFQN